MCALRAVCFARSAAFVPCVPSFCHPPSHGVCPFCLLFSLLFPRARLAPCGHGALRRARRAAGPFQRAAGKCRACLGAPTAQHGAAQRAAHATNGTGHPPLATVVGPLTPQYVIAGHFVCTAFFLHPRNPNLPAFHDTAADARRLMCPLPFLLQTGAQNAILAAAVRWRRLAVTGLPFSSDFSCSWDCLWLQLGWGGTHEHLVLLPLHSTCLRRDTAMSERSM